MADQQTPAPLPEKPWQDPGWLRSHTAGRAWAISDGWVATFFESLAKCGSISKAAQVAGISPKTAYNRRKNDPEFAEEIVQAIQERADRYEEALDDLALVGHPIYKFNPDTKVYDLVGYRKDTIAIIFGLKGMRPHIYRDNYKADSAGDAVAATRVVVNFIKGHDPTADDQASMPSYEEFAREQGLVSLPGPREQKDRRRARLLAELAEIDAGEQQTHDADD